MTAAPEKPHVPGSLAVFDLDGTITRSDTYVRFLLGFLAMKPARLIRCAPLPIYALLLWMGVRDNSWAKQKFLALVCGSAEQQDLAAYCADFAMKVIRNELLADAIAAMESHRARGDHLILISASFDLYVEPLGHHLGFDHVIASKAAWHTDDNGHTVLAGRFDGVNCRGATKVEKLRAYLGDKERSSMSITAYADHHSDVPLLEFADMGYAVNPTPALRKLAAKRGFPVLTWSRVDRAGDRPGSVFPRLTRNRS